MEYEYVTYPGVKKKQYMISKTGDVIDIKHKVHVPVHINRSGYLEVSLKMIRDDVEMSRRVLVHRLVAWEFIPNPNHYPQVNHIDGIKTNPNVTNLEWCTQKYNNEHAIRTGLRPIGEDASYSIISNATAEKICTLMDKGWKNIDIVHELGVPYEIVQNIRNRISWKHISYKYYFGTQKRITEKKAREICRYLELGFSVKDIVKICKVGKSTVLNIRNGYTWKDIASEYNFKFNRHLTEDQVREIRKMHSDGYNCAEISRELGITYRKVNLVVKNLSWQDIV